MPKVNSGLDPDNPEKGEYTALTEYQYAMMEKWSRGDFHADFTTEPAPVPFEKLPLEQRPDALTRAALEGCIGAPFFPGIEVTYVIAQAATYEASFRIRQTLSPGFLTECMAVPWQADFFACGVVAGSTPGRCRDCLRSDSALFRRHTGLCRYDPLVVGVGLYCEEGGSVC